MLNHLDWPQSAFQSASLCRWAAETLASQLRQPESDPAPLLNASLERLGPALEVDDVALWGQASQAMHLQRRAGAHAEPPQSLLREALDRATLVANGRWIAMPLHPQASTGDILVVRRRERAALSLVEHIAATAQVLELVQQAAAEHTAKQHRLAQSEALLHLAQSWNQAHDMPTLLADMADTACRLLAADRASIFLWDRGTHTLVGRPALGIEGGELRVPDDRGVVGRVLESGKPFRVDRTLHQDQVDRQVDARLGYRTETLLCMPLVGPRNERLGVFEVLNKRQGDFTAADQATLEELARLAAVPLANTQERSRLLHSQQQLTEQAASSVQIVGTSPAIEALRATIRQVAQTDLAVLVTGENGTGKEVVSRAIHFQSARRTQPFLAVNCAALSESLLESELFGHERGAFTDAQATRLGKFELASGGTLFLDEIGELSRSGQAKLLRVLEEKIVVRVGGSTSIYVDTRIIAATNRDLAQMVRERAFREDLYYRLNVVSLELPPLRERVTDIVPLAEHFLQHFTQRSGRPLLQLSPAAQSRLIEHAWRGNVRELRNLMERLAYLHTTAVVEPRDLAFALKPTADNAEPIPTDLPLAEATDRFQSDYITRVIRAVQGNMSAAAERLGLHRSNLYRKLRQLGLPSDSRL